MLSSKMWLHHFDCPTFIIVQLLSEFSLQWYNSNGQTRFSLMKLKKNVSIDDD